MPRVVKSCLTVIGTLILLYIVYFISHYSGCFSVSFKPEKHYLKKGFRGKVKIILETDSGKAEIIDGYRIFEIPKEGILYSKFSRNKGWVEAHTLKFYMTDNTDTIEIKRLDDIYLSKGKLDTNEIIVLGFGYSQVTNYGKHQVTNDYRVDTFKNVKKWLKTEFYNSLKK